MDDPEMALLKAVSSRIGEGESPDGIVRALVACGHDSEDASDLVERASDLGFALSGRRLLEEGCKPEELVGKLLRQGCAPAVAGVIAKVSIQLHEKATSPPVETSPPREHRRGEWLGTRMEALIDSDVGAGLLWILGGLAITGLSYAILRSTGTVVIASGAILYGCVRLVIGLVRKS